MRNYITVPEWGGQLGDTPAIIPVDNIAYVGRIRGLDDHEVTRIYLRQVARDQLWYVNTPLSVEQVEHLLYASSPADLEAHL